MAGSVAMFDPLARNRTGTGNTPWSSRTPPPSNPNVLGSPAITSAAIQQNAQDYDNIMGEYQSLLGSARSARTNRTNQPAIDASPVGPNLLNYTQSPTLTNALSEFGNVARSGGFAGNEINDLRARAISPIRSIYANAKRNMDRQKNLSGGYSPNFNAASAKMAREQSSLIGDAMTNANAGIAEMQQRGRLQAMPQYTGLLAGEETARRQIEAANAAEMTRTAEGNRDFALRARSFTNQNEADDFLREMQAIEGMRGLYGTTPANAALYGGQQAQQQQIAQDATSERNRMRQSAWNTARGMFG